MGIQEDIDNAFKLSIRGATPPQRIILYKMQSLDDQIDAAVRDGDELLMAALHGEQNHLLKMLTDLYWQEGQGGGENVS